MIKYLRKSITAATLLGFAMCECTGHQTQSPVILDITNTSNANTCIKQEGTALVGIDKTLEVFEDITHLLVSAVKLYRNGVGLHTFSQMWGIIDSIKELILDLPPAMPELADLDREECSKLGSAAHRMLAEVSKAFTE